MMFLFLMLSMVSGMKKDIEKLFDDDIYEIIKSDEIYGVAYLKYSAHVDAKPHKDFNLWGKDF